ncbi:MAG: sigma-70 family RNA polymerase sigma factor [Verrucomicrobiaceae bacterium]|nr:sigma-70 family RNA polymerase sigma factor [Verrucomicrobiaceae bacterium]
MPLTAVPADSGDAVSDIELVKRAQGGDSRAFDVLVTKYRGRVYGMTYGLVQNQDDAWDLAQEAFIKAWKALGSFKLDSSFYTWLYRIAHNHTYDWLRKRRLESAGEFDDNRADHQPDPTAEAVPHGTPRPDQEMSRGELKERIQAAIQQLSPDHRTAILLKEVEGLKYHEIAEVMGTSIGTVMSRLFYARKKLQELLKDVNDG